MKILMTGAGGQVGRALVASAPGRINLVRCSHADLNIADLDSVLRCIREHAPDAIINAAAYTAVDRAESEPDWARRVNTDGPRYLALAAGEVGARLVHLSTDFVFDGTSPVPYRPEAPTNPLNVYGLTKRDGEEAVLGILPESSIVLRTAWVYAAEGHNFVRTMLRLMRANGSVRVVRDQVGTPTAARSIAEIIWKLTENPAIRGTYHWTDSGIASWYDFAVAVGEEASHLGMVSPRVTVHPIATDEYPTPARRPAYSVLDTRSLDSLGLLPEHWRKRLRSILGDIKNA